MRTTWDSLETEHIALGTRIPRQQALDCLPILSIQPHLERPQIVLQMACIAGADKDRPDAGTLEHSALSDVGDADLTSDCDAMQRP